MSDNVVGKIEHLVTINERTVKVLEGLNESDMIMDGLIKHLTNQLKEAQRKITALEKKVEELQMQNQIGDK